MTFTLKDAAGFVARHRFLVYAAATLALTAVLLLTYTPAQAAGGAITSPADLLDPRNGGTGGRWQYLTFGRWNSLLPGGQPPIIGIAPQALSILLYLIGHVLFVLIGWVVMLVASADMYWNLLYFGDWVFSQFAIVRNGTVSFSGLLASAGFLAVAVLALTLAPGLGSGLKAKLGGGGESKSPLRGGAATVAWMVGGIVALSLMAANSSYNHDGSRRTVIGSTAAVGPGAQNSINDASVGTLAKEPKNWQPLSLGWAISWGAKLAGFVGNVAVEVVGSVTTSLTFGSSSANNNCESYVQAMHGLYQDGYSNGKVVIALDDLYRVAVLKSFVTGNFGSSEGAQNAWCRVLDNGTSVAEQVLISDRAGLYTQALNVMIDGDKRWTQNSKTSVSGRDIFKNQNFGAGLAMSFFSPPAQAGEDKGTAAHRNYFAACESVGGNMRLNDEWKGVRTADDESKSIDDFDVSADHNICQAIANGDVSGGLEGDNGSAAVGFWDKASDSNGDPGSNGGKTVFVKKLAFQGVKYDNLITILFSGAGVAQTNFFASANDGGLAGPAYNYYATTNGLNWDSGFFLSLLVLVVVIAIARIVVPLVAGAIIAQVCVVVLMAFFPLTLAALVVYPTKNMRTMNLRMYGGMVAGALVNMLFTAVFMLYAALFGFVKSVATLPPASGPASLSALSEGLGIVIASFVSFYLIKLALARFLKFDVTNIKGAVQSSFGSVMGGMTKPLGGLRGATADAVRSARHGMFKEPAAKPSGMNAFVKMRKATADAATDVSKILRPVQQVKDPKKKDAPQSAAVAKPMATDEPLVGRIFGPGTGPAAAGAAGNGPRPHPGPNRPGGALLSDEQHRNKLLDQIKAAYGTTKLAAVFRNGLPGNWEQLIGSASLAEVQKLAGLLRGFATPSNAPRATAAEAAENLRKFREASQQTMRETPNGFDANLSYAERAAAQANMFRNINPLTNADLGSLTPEERRAFNRREFDRVGSSLPDNRAVSFGRGADVIPGEVVPDPRTERSLPNAVVRSGSQNLASMEGVTQDGTTLFGAAPDKKTGAPNWDLVALDSGTHQIAPSSMLPGAVPPVGVSTEQWAEVGDLHGWIRGKGLSLTDTAIASWPQDRQEQARRVAATMEAAMRAQAVPMVRSDQLEALSGDGVGLVPADAFAFGASTPEKSFSPAALRNALAQSREQGEMLRAESAERMQSLIADRVSRQTSAIEAGIKQEELKLTRALDERVALETRAATDQLSGLVADLGESNADAARSVAQLASSGRWDDLVGILDEGGAGNDEAGAELRSEIRDLAESSRDRIAAAKMSHARNVADLYANLSAERESIAEQAHADIEAELQSDIDRHVAEVQEAAFSGATETGRGHIEKVLRWFPSARTRLFGRRPAPAAVEPDPQDEDEEAQQHEEQQA